MTPKLSICIPTRNRCEHLKRTVNELRRQIREGDYENIEICVSDNASSDGTDKFLSETYLTKHRFRYNCGFSRNLSKVTDIAQGEYIWLLGDDDKISPFALMEIMLRLQGNKLGLLHLNTLCNQENTIQLSKDRYFHTGKDFINYALEYLGPHDLEWITFTFMSSLVVNRELYKKHESTIKYLPHSFTVFSYLVNEPMLLLQRPLVEINLDSGPGCTYITELSRLYIYMAWKYKRPWILVLMVKRVLNIWKTIVMEYFK